MGKLGYLEVEAGIVDEDDYIRVPCKDILLAELYIVKEFPGLHQDFHKSHDRTFLVVLYQAFLAGFAHCQHQVASPETDFRLRVFGV